MFICEKRKQVALARKKASFACPMTKASSVGTALGIRVVSLAAFLIFLARKKKMPTLALETCLNELVESGYYLKTADYLAVLRAIRMG